MTALLLIFLHHWAQRRMFLLLLVMYKIMSYFLHSKASDGYQLSVIICNYYF